MSVAQAAARLMAEQGINDFLLAKRKAAEQLHIRDKSALPSNAEIEAALVARQRLFHAATHASVLRELRSSAARIMRLLHQFNPRLVGPVLNGTATEHSEINIHVFVAQPEQIAFSLMEQRIATSDSERKLRYETDRWISYPCFRFLAGNHAVEVVVLAEKDLRQAPLSPVDGKPMPRASLADVTQLLQ